MSLFINFPSPNSRPMETELKDITKAKPILEQEEIDSLRSALSTESTHELLDKAVKLTPCSHSIPEGTAVGLFGMIGEYNGLTTKECPECKKNVQGAFVDHKIRNLIQVLSKILDQSNSTLTEKEIKDLRSEITCPIELDDLLEGVLLIPCAHRIQMSVAKRIFGEMIGEHCEKDMEKCPECRLIINGYIADPNIRKISQILPKILDKFESAFSRPTATTPPSRPTITDPIAYAMHEISSDRELMNAVRNWAQSVCNRRLTHEEMNLLDILPRHMTADEHDELIQRSRTAKRNFEAFYEIFKNKLSSWGIGINSDEFFIYYVAVTRHLQDLMPDKTNQNTPLHLACPTKHETAIKKFNKKIFYDILNNFAGHPLQDLTIENYKATVDFIKKYFAHIDSSDIEMELRKAIHEHHDSVEFSSLLNPEIVSRELTALQDQFIHGNRNI